MFDCSGFVLYVLRQDTGLVSWGDDTAGGIKNRLPSTGNPEKGDLVFYSSGGGVQHVEMVAGSGTKEIGASGGGSSTYGRDPSAKVQWGDMTADRRKRSYGSIEGLLATAAKKKKS
jgi:cell wall-associated NlpC family hydrolase